MSDSKAIHKREQEIIAEARRARLEGAMKANLKRRKEQARARRHGAMTGDDDESQVEDD